MIISFNFEEKIATVPNSTDDRSTAPSSDFRPPDQIDSVGIQPLQNAQTSNPAVETVNLTSENSPYEVYAEGTFTYFRYYYEKIPSPAYSTHSTPQRIPTDLLQLGVVAGTPLAVSLAAGALLPHVLHDAPNLPPATSIQAQSSSETQSRSPQPLPASPEQLAPERTPSGFSNRASASSRKSLLKQTATASPTQSTTAKPAVSAVPVVASEKSFVLPASSVQPVVSSVAQIPAPTAIAADPIAVPDGSSSNSDRATETTSPGVPQSPALNNPALSDPALSNPATNAPTTDVSLQPIAPVNPAAVNPSTENSAVGPSSPATTNLAPSQPSEKQSSGLSNPVDIHESFTSSWTPQTVSQNISSLEPAAVNMAPPEAMLPDAFSKVVIQSKFSRTSLTQPTSIR